MAYINEDFVKQYRKKKNLTKQDCMEKTDEFMNKASWDYSFINESPQRLDSEASALSQMLFVRLIGVPFECVDIAFTSKIKVKGIELSFDIMNNPNSSCRNFYRLGSRAERNKIERLGDWKKVKYTIGNFTPIPNSNGKKMRHLQLIHNDKSERWDYLLEYLEYNWENYSSELFPDFVDYIIKTAQHIYYEKIFIDLQNKLKNREIDQVGDDEWFKWVEEWNGILKDKNDGLKLICFGPKTIEKGNIEDIIRDICWLIEMRGRLIRALLMVNRNNFFKSSEQQSFMERRK